jgi:DNA polymerase III sliding clamp (beta) subunit (PCNA family)
MVVKRKNPYPIVDNLLFNDGTVEFTNLDIHVILNNFALRHTKEKFLVNCLDLVHILQLVTEPITWTTEIKKGSQDGKLFLMNRAKTLVLPVQKQGDFPAPDLVDFKKLGELRYDTILQAVRAIKYTSDDELRPIMNCVYIDKERVVASDAHMLTYEEHSSPIETPILMNRVALRILGELGHSVEVFQSKNNIVYQNDEFTVIHRAESQKYPHYLSVIPKEYHTIVKFDRLTMLEQFKMLKQVANRSTGTVKFDFWRDKDLICLSPDDLDTGISFDSKIPAFYEGEDPEEMGFKIKFLEQILTESKDRLVIMKLEDPIRAAIINDTKLVMPVI